MIPEPHISVVMSVYNGAKYLDKTIVSILNQKFVNLELIVVDDGSTDETGFILDTFQKKDQRVKIISPNDRGVNHALLKTEGLTQRKYSGSRASENVSAFELSNNDGSSGIPIHEMLESSVENDAWGRITPEKNEGLTKALIDGCNVAVGKYIARIDVGDIMVSERLQIQQKYLDDHPEVGFVSCWTEFCGPEWEHLYLEKRDSERFGSKPIDITPIKEEGDLCAGPTHHGSVMFRKSTYEDVGGYRWQFYYAQDWDLWYRLSRVSKFALIPKTLYKCRIFPDGISSINVEQQSALAKLYKQAYWNRCRGISENEVLAEASLIRKNFYSKYKQSKQLGGNYFIGSMLRKNKNRRCLVYFCKELKKAPFSLRLWIAIVRGMMGV